MASQRRRQQRNVYRQANFIRIKNSLMRFSDMAVEWYTARRNEGIEKQKQFLSETLDSLESQRMTRLNKLKEDLKNQGYNDKEIELLEESWSLLIDSEDWRNDKKMSRRLSREAFISRQSRA